MPILPAGNANHITFSHQHSRRGEAVDLGLQRRRRTAVQFAKIDTGQLTQSEKQFLFECAIATHPLHALFGNLTAAMAAHIAGGIMDVGPALRCRKKNARPRQTQIGFAAPVFQIVARLETGLAQLEISYWS